MNEREIKITDKHGFIKTVYVKHSTQHGFSTAYLYGNILTQIEYGRFHEPSSDDDSEWESHEERLQEIECDLSGLCKEIIDNKTFYKHAVKCVNERETILKQNDDLIFKNSELGIYKQACEQINKDNPLAVAENLNTIYLFLKSIHKLKDIWTTQKVSIEDVGKATALILLYDQLTELLTKIEKKE